MQITMDRYDACKMMLACTFVSEELKREADDPDTTADRKEIAERSAKMWDRIHDELKYQIDKWDAKHQPK